VAAQHLPVPLPAMLAVGLSLHVRVLSPASLAVTLAIGPPCRRFGPRGFDGGLLRGRVPGVPTLPGRRFYWAVIATFITFMGTKFEHVGNTLPEQPLASRPRLALRDLRLLDGALAEAAPWAGVPVTDLDIAPR
jgi:hypothetical protein